MAATDDTLAHTRERLAGLRAVTARLDAAVQYATPTPPGHPLNLYDARTAFERAMIDAAPALLDVADAAARLVDEMIVDVGGLRVVVNGPITGASILRCRQCHAEGRGVPFPQEGDPNTIAHAAGCPIGPMLAALRQLAGEAS